MDTRLLKMFCAVAEGGSLPAAANKLHLTASAISHGLKSLETQVGCRLFERAGKKLILNQAGEQLLTQIRVPLAALDAAGESLRRLARWGQTRLRVGAAASLCQYLLPAVINELRKVHARLELHAESGDTTDLVEKLRANKIDLAFGVTPENEDGLTVRGLFRDELMFAFAPSHSWAIARSVKTEELRKQPLILYKSSSLTGNLVDKFFRDLNLVPSTVIEIQSIEAIKELVKLNLGVGVLAPWVADRELLGRKLIMRPLASKPLVRNWAAFYLKTHRLALLEESFYKLCRRHAAGLRLDRKDLPR